MTKTAAARDVSGRLLRSLPPTTRGAGPAFEDDVERPWEPDPLELPVAEPWPPGQPPGRVPTRRDGPEDDDAADKDDDTPFGVIVIDLC